MATRLRQYVRDRLGWTDVDLARFREGVNAKQSQDREAVDFLRSSFVCKECQCCVAKYPKDPQFVFIFTKACRIRRRFSSRCHCGAAFEEHENQANLVSRNANTGGNLQERGSGEWTRDCIEAKPTNSFGRITFHPGIIGYRKPAKYVRLGEDSDVEKVVELAIRFWGLAAKGHPELIVSVIGGGKQFRVSGSRKRAIFNRGILRSVLTTNGWLLTNGVNFGVARAVGDAVREGQSLLWNSDDELTRSVSAIGVCPWGAIRNRSHLVNPDTQRLHGATYFVDPYQRRNQPDSLNPDHSHFLLVDDGLRNRERGVVEHFRAVLEQQLSRPAAEGGVGAPVVCLLVEGGTGSVRQLHESVSHGTPALICDGTGRAADLLAAVLHQFKAIANTLDADARDSRLESLRKDVEAQLDALFDGDRATRQRKQELELAASHIMEICNYHERIFVFQFEHQGDLDLAILSSIMEGKKMDLLTQLMLAHRWNRPDVASQRILSDPTFRLETDVAFQLFGQSLLQDQYEFVELFIENCVSVKQFLSVKRLRDLYNEALDASLFLKGCVTKENNDVLDGTLSEVYAFLRSCTCNYEDELFAEDTEENLEANGLKHFAQPHQELFIWAVVFNRRELAVNLWQRCREPLTMALVGALLARGVGDRLQQKDAQAAADYTLLKGNLEALALGVAEQAFVTDRAQCAHLLRRRSSKWANRSCIELAGLAAAERFLSAPCCQTTIFDVWKGGFELSALQVVAAALTVLPVAALRPRAPVEQADAAARRRAPSARRQPCDPLLLDTADVGLVQRQQSIQQESIFSVKTTNRAFSWDLKSAVFGYTKRSSFEMVDSAGRSATADLTIERANNLLQVYMDFYSAPIVKFANHMVWYLIYLVLYAYVLLFTFRLKAIHWTEILLYFWQLTFLCELANNMLRQVGSTGGGVLNRLGYWLRRGAFASWHQLELLALVVSVAVLLLRWSPLTFPFARLLMAVGAVIYAQALFKAHYVNSYLGPKVIMIKRMSWDIAMFLLVIVVFFVSYSVASQSLIYSERPFSWSIFWQLFNHGVWETFGEPQDDAMRGFVPDCEGNRSTTLDCQMRSWPIPLFLAAYLLFANVLLVNMLIATFTHVFDDIQANSERIWKTQMYFVVEEFRRKPILPPPMIAISHALSLIRRLCCYQPMHRRQKLTEAKLEFLRIFELVCQADFIANRAQSDQTGKLERVVASLRLDVDRLIETTAASAGRRKSRSTAMSMKSLTEVDGADESE